VRAHLAGRDDAPVEVGPALQRARRFAYLLESSLGEQAAPNGFETLSPNGRPRPYRNPETVSGGAFQPGASVAPGGVAGPFAESAPALPSVVCPNCLKARFREYA
jgi:hypothetical protein